MDTLGMWQQVGFLAIAFNTFAQHGVSVDLVSTSEANVTVSFDPAGVDTAAVVHVTRGETKNVEKNTALAQFPLYITARVHG